jgi:ABC-2 type transport system ATP-binding protein
VRAEGRTVLLSSPILSEVETAADRVSIVRAGRIVDSGTLADLRHLTRTAVTAETERPPDGLAEMPGVHGLEATGATVHFHVDTVDLAAAIGRLSAAGIRSLISNPPTLEEMFLRLYGDELASEQRAHDGAARG